MGTVAGNLCQGGSLLVLPPPRPDLLAGRRRHLLRPDRRPPKARPGDRRLHLGRAQRPRGRAAGPRRRGHHQPPHASAWRSSTGGRPRTTVRRSRCEPGELITAAHACRARPLGSAYARTGERAAWSFALTGVAAARFDDGLRVAAIGVSNLPRLIDPDDPLAGLPGLEGSRWKRALPDHAGRPTPSPRPGDGSLAGARDQRCVLGQHARRVARRRRRPVTQARLRSRRRRARPAAHAPRRRTR